MELNFIELWKSDNKKEFNEKLEKVKDEKDLLGDDITSILDNHIKKLGFLTKRE